MENGRTTDNGYYGETDLIETTDEEGTVHIFEKISEIEVEGQEYALLIYKGNEEKPETKGEEGYDEEVVVMKISYEDGQEVYEAIEDETEFERVVSFIENMEDDESEYVVDVTDFLPSEEDEPEIKN